MVLRFEKRIPRLRVVITRTTVRAAAAAAVLLLLLLLLLTLSVTGFGTGGSSDASATKDEQHEQQHHSLYGFFLVADAFSPPQVVFASTPTQKLERKQYDADRSRFRFRKTATSGIPSCATTTTTTTMATTTTTTITKTQLSAVLPFYATDVEEEKSQKNKPKKNNNDDDDDDDDDAAAVSTAYLIESITTAPSSGDAIYKEIANLCIDVFFKELIDPTGKGNVNLLKAWQINYLKNLQAADLERRRIRQPDTNQMFLAYEVRKTRGLSDALRQPLLMDDQLEGAYNIGGIGNENGNDDDDDDDDASYVRGDLLGFVEITQRPYGLGGASPDPPTLLDLASGSGGGGGGGYSIDTRPVLTNLAVLKDSRGCGIGSRLLETCEDHVLETWKMREIVLEVEDYNASGLEFYKRKGYGVVFSDPASRRFDIQGFWLNKVRCRRDIMRKELVRRQRRRHTRTATTTMWWRRDNKGGPLTGMPKTVLETADGLLRRISNFF